MDGCWGEDGEKDVWGERLKAGEKFESSLSEF